VNVARKRNVVVTRVDPATRPRLTRTVDERLIARFPRTFRRVVAPAFGRLDRRSRLRRAILRRAIVAGWAEVQRRDFDLNVLFFAADSEYEAPPEVQALDQAGPLRGRERRVEALERLLEVWGFEFGPVYLVDLGDRVLSLGVWQTRGRGSGVPLARDLAQLLTLRHGLVAREQIFFSWEEGLRAAGLEPGSLDLPRP
jgi:hypothetical protein